MWVKVDILNFLQLRICTYLRYFNQEYNSENLLNLLPLEPIELIQASSIRKEYTTKGSKPLLVNANKGDLYVAKTCIQIKPTVEIINEVVCAYFAHCWRLKVPDFSLIQIGEDIYKKYIGESGTLSIQYTKDSFGERK